MAVKIETLGELAQVVEDAHAASKRADESYIAARQALTDALLARGLGVGDRLRVTLPDGRSAGVTLRVTTRYTRDIEAWRDAYRAGRITRGIYERGAPRAILPASWRKVADDVPSDVASDVVTKIDSDPWSAVTR